MTTRRDVLEKAFRGAVTSAGLLSAAAVILIFLFLVVSSVSLFVGDDYSPIAFFTHRLWRPTSTPPDFGIVPLFLGTLVVSIGALIIAVPFGVATATFLSEVAPSNVREILKPVIELLAAIPSVVIGFVGIKVIAPAIKDTFHLDTGNTALTGSIALAVMAIPTIVTIAEDALAAVPRSFRDASLALGANPWQTTWRVVIPAAAPGLLAAIILGAARVMGETMAVLMVTGNAPNVTLDPRSPVRTMTATIAAEMGEAVRGSDHYHALFAIGAVLYAVTLAVNAVASFVLERARKRMGGAA